MILPSFSLTPREFNSYGARRGNDAVMTRGTFASIKLLNLLIGKPGPKTVHIPSGQTVSCSAFLHNAYIQSTTEPLKGHCAIYLFIFLCTPHAIVSSESLFRFLHFFLKAEICCVAFRIIGFILLLLKNLNLYKSLYIFAKKRRNNISCACSSLFFFLQKK